MIARSMTFAAQLTRTWVALYTAGLPEELTRARRDEIESDLWEQDLVGVTNGEALARLVLGMPADLLWRLEQRTSTSAHPAGERRTLMQTITSRGVPAFTALLILAAAGLFIFGGISAIAGIAGGNAEDPWRDKMQYGLPAILAGGLMVTGYLLQPRAPWLGMGLIVLGVAGMNLVWFWLFILFVPLALVVAGLAYYRARGFANPHGPAASPA